MREGGRGISSSLGADDAHPVALAVDGDAHGPGGGLRRRNGLRIGLSVAHFRHQLGQLVRIASSTPAMETTLTSWLVETGSGEQHGGARGERRGVP